MLFHLFFGQAGGGSFKIKLRICPKKKLAYRNVPTLRPRAHADGNHHFPNIPTWLMCCTQRIPRHVNNVTAKASDIQYSAHYTALHRTSGYYRVLLLRTAT